MATREKNDAIRKLSRKLAIISLRYCVSYYGRGDIDGLAAEIEERLRLPGPTTKQREERDV